MPFLKSSSYTTVLVQLIQSEKNFQDCKEFNLVNYEINNNFSIHVTNFHLFHLLKIMISENIVNPFKTKRGSLVKLI